MDRPAKMTADEVAKLAMFGLPPGVAFEDLAPLGAVLLFIFLCIAVVCAIRSHDRPE